MVELDERVAPTDIEESMRVGCDRAKFQIKLPLPPKIDPSVTMMQVEEKPDGECERVCVCVCVCVCVVTRCDKLIGGAWTSTLAAGLISLMPRGVTLAERAVLGA